MCIHCLEVTATWPSCGRGRVLWDVISLQTLCWEIGDESRSHQWYARCITSASNVCVNVSSPCQRLKAPQDCVKEVVSWVMFWRDKQVAGGCHISTPTLALYTARTVWSVTTGSVTPSNTAQQPDSVCAYSRLQRSTAAVSTQCASVTDRRVDT